MPETDAIMEAASEQLALMNYLDAETKCLEALSIARHNGQWDYYSRILMPLLECRRQRRMIAAEGTVRIGTNDLEFNADEWLSRCPTGCVVVTAPHTPADALELRSIARQSTNYVEVLFADRSSWSVQSLAGPSVSCKVAAPTANTTDQWLEQSTTAGDWFIDAMEALGDAALATVDHNADPIAQIESLEHCLETVTDHEIIHQRLADAARAARFVGNA
jgi:hypothetical protein